MGILRKYKQGQRAPLGNGAAGGMATTPNAMGRMGVRALFFFSSCCRVKAVSSALSRTSFLGWICTVQIPHNISELIGYDLDDLDRDVSVRCP